MPFLSQNSMHMIFRVEVVCLNFVFVGDEVCLHSMDCCFDSGVACDTPCLVLCDYMAQEVIAFLTVSCQKVQCTGLPFEFVFFRKHLRHPACTQFPKLKFIRHNFVKKWPWNLRKMQGKLCNGESSVLSNLLFNCTHQIFIHHRRSAAPQIIMHIFSSFIKQSHLSLYHWTAHDMFSIHVTKLTMNFSRFHVLRIQETDYRPHFTCGGVLYFLKHYKHTARCVNAESLQIASMP